MTRKDFELIASTIAGLFPGQPEYRGTVAAHFADKLATANAGFNHDRFFKACGVATSAAREQYLHRDLLTDVKFASPRKYEPGCECLGECAD